MSDSLNKMYSTPLQVTKARLLSDISSLDIVKVCTDLKKKKKKWEIVAERDKV